jgi:Tfp pilus assembly protein PilN
MRAVNLLPRDEGRPERPSGLAVALGAVAVAAVTGAVGLAAMAASAKVADREAELAAARATLAAIPRERALTAAEARLVDLRSRRLGALAGALDGRLAWDGVIRQIAAVLPQDVWLSALRGETPDAPAPAPAPATTTAAGGAAAGTTASAPAPASEEGLTLEGFAYTHAAVARLLARLTVVRALDDVRLIRSERAPVPAGGSRVNFQIAAQLRAGGAS